MTTFKIHTPDTAPEAKRTLDGIESSMGFIPNLLGTMAEAPALLEGYMSLSSIFDKADLTATERQVVLMTNNRLNGCSYCMSAHTTIAKKQGVPEDVIESLRTGTPIADSRLEALRTFAIKVNESRGRPEQSDLDALFEAGYGKRTVLEVVLGTALKVLSNYTNHVASTPVDPAFEATAWSEDLLASPS